MLATVTSRNRAEQTPADEKMRLTITFISLLVAISWAVTCTAMADGPSPSPIQIEADRMESVQEQNLITFSGNVVARQDDLIIHADQMTVDYVKLPAESRPEAVGDTTGGSAQQKINKIIARGNVKIVQKDWVAVGNTMDYIANERKVILTGNAKTWQGKNMVAGDTIILYLDEGKSVVERSKEEGGRVKALIYPDSQPAETKQ
jgi:lipopolysaccharide export system protein LptA